MRLVTLDRRRLKDGLCVEEARWRKPMEYVRVRVLYLLIVADLRRGLLQHGARAHVQVAQPALAQQLQHRRAVAVVVAAAPITVGAVAQREKAVAQLEAPHEVVELVRRAAL